MSIPTAPLRSSSSPTCSSSTSGGASTSAPTAIHPAAGPLRRLHQRLAPSKHLHAHSANQSPARAVAMRSAEAIQRLQQSALGYTRENAATKARRFYSELLERSPTLVTAWISWAQMEKRIGEEAGAAAGSGPSAHERCRLVLQHALAANPESSAITQAWGLFELQRGNFLAAIILLERSARLDPERCLPVLRWKQVVSARQTVGSRVIQRGGKSMLALSIGGADVVAGGKGVGGGCESGGAASLAAAVAVFANSGGSS